MLAALARAMGLQLIVGLFLFAFDLGQALLQIFQSQLELILVHLLGAFAELQPAQLGDDVFVARGLFGQQVDLGFQGGDLGIGDLDLSPLRGRLLDQLRRPGPLRQQHGAERLHIIRQVVQGDVHSADKSIKSGS